MLKEDLPKKLTGHPNQPKLPLGGLYVLFFLQLTPGLRDLSKAKKEITVCKAEQIHKMTTIFTQNEDA